MTHPGSSSRPRTVLPLLALLALAACQSGGAHQVKRSASAPAQFAASAVVVYPFGFRWEAPPWRAVELSQRLVAVGLAEAGEAALFFGPTEVRVYRPEDDNAWAASDAVAVLAPHGVAPDHALVLRPWAEQRRQSGARELQDSRGRTVGRSATEDVVYVGHVEVVHPATRQVVLEVSGEAAVDPFAERTDEGADPAPELTALMETLTREALRALEDTLRPPRTPSPPLARVDWVPWEALDLSVELAGRDALDAELLRQQRLRFANPGLELPALEALARAPAGLRVREAGPGGKLAPGDVVLTLDGRPALPQALARARLALVPVEARVRRPSGETVPVLLP